MDHVKNILFGLGCFGLVLGITYCIIHWRPFDYAIVAAMVIGMSWVLGSAVRSFW